MIEYQTVVLKAADMITATTDKNTSKEALISASVLGCIKGFQEIAALTLGNSPSFSKGKRVTKKSSEATQDKVLNKLANILVAISSLIYLRDLELDFFTEEEIDDYCDEFDETTYRDPILACILGISYVVSIHDTAFQDLAIDEEVIPDEEIPILNPVDTGTGPQTSAIFFNPERPSVSFNYDNSEDINPRIVEEAMETMEPGDEIEEGEDTYLATLLVCSLFIADSYEIDYQDVKAKALQLLDLEEGS